MSDVVDLLRRAAALLRDGACVGVPDPPVALPLADWLDVEAEHAEVSPAGCCPELRVARLALARAVLREEASS